MEPGRHRALIQNVLLKDFGFKNKIWAGCVKSPTLKAVLKYGKHPSIISISHSSHQASSFNFSCIDKNTVLKEIRSLSITKASKTLIYPWKC